MTTPIIEDLGRTILSGCRSYSLKSRNVDQTYQIDVALPARRFGPDQPLPVVYITDGNSTFALAAQVARMLQSGPDALPPFLVVGIGYRFDKTKNLTAQYFDTRTRDFTAIPDPDWLEMSRVALAEQGAEVSTATGGAPAFLAFIEEELKPFVAARYSVDTANQTLTGMSLGGLFALHVLFHAPQSFSRYAALSPALWWGNGELFRNEVAMAGRTHDLPLRLFLAVGDLEEGDDTPYASVSSLRKMHEILASRRYPSLKLAHQIFAGETHISAYPAAFCRALRVLFAQQ